MASQVVDRASGYLEQHNIRALLEAVTVAILLEQPTDPLLFMISGLERYRSLKPDDRLSTPLSAGFFLKRDSAVDAGKKAGDKTEVSTNENLVQSESPFRMQASAMKDRNGVKHMEDECLSVLLEEHPIMGIFGIFDGHSMDKKKGKVAAQIAKHNSLWLLLKQYDENARSSQPDGSMSKVFEATFQGTEKIMAKYSKDFDFAGCTATLAAVVRQGDKKLLMVGNVGDSSAVLCRGGQAVMISRDHKSTDPDERARAEAAGAFLTAEDQYGMRVNGLQVTRSLGDLKSDGTICDPSFSVTELEPSDSFLVIGSDGLWDNLSPDEVCSKVSNASGSATERCEMLMKAVKEKAQSPEGKKDNLSIVVVIFKFTPA